MPIFHFLAYQAACYDDLPSQHRNVGPEHFNATADLERVLARLSAEQLCNAFYGDWLLQLDSVAGPAQLQVRSFLIGGGALAANYLAELAQNADDASDGWDAEVRLCVTEDWLLVANNGRKITPGNLHGLCRFFVHRGGRTHQLDAATIGKFGIGFKSSYRIASEVRVCSWDTQSGELAFRLPISKADVPDSLPDPERQRSVVEGLRRVGAELGESGLTPDRLGYGTPEYLADGLGLPAVVARAAENLRHPARGTLFAFHLHPDGTSLVRARIAGQEADGLYELCPLFLPKLRTVGLGARELRMSIGHLNDLDGIAGRVEARKVTLRTAEDGRTSRDCFWRLRGTTPGDSWQIALHTDTEFRLRTERDPDASRSVREGGAYAFFPLNDANRDFSLRLHLHLDLPTNLSRSDWNPAETQNVRVQIGRAVAGLGEWLEANQQKYHASWGVEKLFSEQPPATAEWAHAIFTDLRSVLRNRRLLRTLWGGWRRAPEALAVRLSAASAVRNAWRELCQEVSEIGGQFPFVELSGQIDLGVPDATAEHLREFFARASEHAAPSTNFWKNMLHCVLGAEALAPKHIEEALKLIPIDCPHGAPITAATAMQRPAGVELTGAWHAAFVTTANWLQDDPRRMMSIFGEALATKVNRLREPRFSVGWDAIAERMESLATWAQHGDQFWSAPMPGPCPSSLQDEVIAALRVKDGTGRWQRVTEIWLLDSLSVPCFHGVVRPWNRGTALNNSAQSAAREKLGVWNLLAAYEAAIEAHLETGLAGRLQELFDARPAGSLDLLTDPGHRNGRNNLPAQRWKRLVQAAEYKALKEFLKRQRMVYPTAKIFLNTQNTQFPYAIRHILALLLPGFAESPPWLHAGSWALLQEHGLTQGAGFEWLGEPTVERRREWAEELLGRFYLWKDRPLEPSSLAALDAIFAEARGTWSVRLASNQPKRINELRARVVREDADVAARDFECNITHAGKVIWHAEQLPEPLAHIPNIARHAIEGQSLRLEALSTGLVVPSERVHADILSTPAVAALLEAKVRRVEYLPPPLNLRWISAGRVICEVAGAAFGFDGERLLVSRLAAAPDERQYERILTTYELVAPEDGTFRAARGDGRPADVLYREFRPAILRVLREKLVAEEGYEARHIVRELLQNAESAYASQGHAPALATVPSLERTRGIRRTGHHGVCACDALWPRLQRTGSRGQGARE